MDAIRARSIAPWEVSGKGKLPCGTGGRAVVPFRSMRSASCLRVSAKGMWIGVAVGLLLAVFAPVGWAAEAPSAAPQIAPAPERATAIRFGRLIDGKGGVI